MCEYRGKAKVQIALHFRHFFTVIYIDNRANETLWLTAQYARLVRITVT